MPIKIHNKDYKTVVERVNEFRNEDKYKHWSIETEILRFEGDDCIIKAVIMDDKQAIKATGLAHEVQGSTNINKTSHVENCETSAIGRALAALGLAGTEYASGDEVGTAIINQAVKDALGKAKTLLDAVMQYHSSVMVIKEGVAIGELSAASEEWFTLDDEVKAKLWLSTTAGGCFSTKEREAIASTEFRQAYYGDGK